MLTETWLLNKPQTEFRLLISNYGAKVRFFICKK